MLNVILVIECSYEKQNVFFVSVLIKSYWLFLIREWFISRLFYLVLIYHFVLPVVWIFFIILFSNLVSVVHCHLIERSNVQRCSK